MMIPKTNYELAKNFFYSQPYGKFLHMANTVLENDFEYEALYKLMAEVYGESDTQKFITNVNMFFHVLHMERNGEKIYYVAPGLATRLAQTEMNIDSFFLKSPFREIYFQIDPGLFFMKDVFDKIIPVTGFYVYLKEYSDHKLLRVMVSGASKTPDGLDFGSIFYLKMEFESGKIQEQIKEYATKNSLDVENLKKFGGMSNIDYWKDFVYFVFNALLYITSKNPDFSSYIPIDASKKLSGLKNVAKKRKFEQRMSKVSQNRIIVVGASVVDQNNDMAAIQAAGGIGSWKLTKRVKVSGHWRCQRYGSAENSRQEIIWIHDYEKGPELAELLKTPYVVK